MSSELKPVMTPDKFGRKFTYYHGTNTDIKSIVEDGIKPGSDGYSYLTVRRDFAENYGKVILEVRLPYELECNPFSPTINGEYRCTETILPENIKILLPAKELAAQLQAAKAEAEQRLAEQLHEDFGAWHHKSGASEQEADTMRYVAAPHVTEVLKQLTTPKEEKETE